MNKQILKIDELTKETLKALNCKYNYIKENYKELYKDYDSPEQIKEINLNEIKRDIDKINNYINNKETYIYILFKYIEVIGYNKIFLLKCKLSITKDNYFNQLNQLPPLKYLKNGFLSSEFTTGNITAKYTKDIDKYYIEFIEVY